MPEIKFKLASISNNRSSSFRDIYLFDAMSSIKTAALLVYIYFIHYKSCNMRFSTMWCVRPTKAQISLRIRAVWSEPLQVAWTFYEC